MSEIFYHVDREGTLEAGQILNLEPLKLDDEAADFHLAALFPDGISAHGRRYLATQMKNEQKYEEMLAMELIFEYVRRSCYPDRPSRYQSVFASSSYEEALLFAGSFPSGKQVDEIPVWEVSAHAAFRADMALLSVFHNGTVWSLAAHLYWSGEPGCRHSYPFEAQWEYLLVPPVTVIRRAGELCTAVKNAD